MIMSDEYNEIEWMNEHNKEKEYWNEIESARNDRYKNKRIIENNPKITKNVNAIKFRSRIRRNESTK